MNDTNHTSLVEGVVDGLAQQILATPDSADAWLPTTAQLTDQYGVSRTVVREAINRLESQGLIEARHGVGLRGVRRLHKPVMASLTLLLPDRADRLRQATEVRFLLEVEIARLAATHMGDAGLRQLLEAQSRLAAPGVTVDAAVEADTDFHRVLAEQCGNLVLKLMLDSIVGLCRESRTLTLSRVGFDRAYTSHQRIVEAIARRDPDGAADAMRQHIEFAMADLTVQIDELRQEDSDD